MAAEFDILLMVKVAQMFYLNDMEQEEIAQRLEVPPSTISRILAKAVESGIVDVKIKNVC